MKKNFLNRVLCVALLFVTLSLDAFATDVDNAWQFRVLLDGKPIGTHNFELTNNGGTRLVQSEAAFDVKFLFFTAYQYRHRNTEEWSGGCLREIDARTVTNGKEQDVTGQQDGEQFVVQTASDKDTLPSCVMTFAYWNPDFLTQKRLLNPQTGAYLDVNIEPLGTDTIDVRGESLPAKRYRVTAKDTDLEVWYSANNEWLALESVAKGGRIIRYELI